VRDVDLLLSVDQVGSTRLITDASGGVQHRYDYLPFGEEIPVSTVVSNPSWRTTAMGYAIGPDGFSIKYTEQYRDTETGLDYFNARYYSPTQGRFVSPDPENAGSNPGDPTTWNGYAYVGGNPLNVTDTAGLGFWSDFAGFFANLFGGGGITNFGVNDGPWNEQVPGGSNGG
jgi:RHS repeat-associated protein